MTIQEIYHLAIQKGIGADPRGKTGIEKLLKKLKKEYEELSEQKKEDFDEESLTNPYADSRILTGSPKTEVKKALMGVDIGVGEVMLADRLNQKGEKIDLLIAHHPEGGALASLHEVMELQIDLLASYGVPENVGYHLMSERIEEVFRRFSPVNHFQTIDAARLLNFPLMCLHTPCDNLGWKYLSDHLEKRNYDAVGEVMDALNEIPEFKIAKKQKAGPTIFNGSEKARAGKVKVVEFTGGTEGAKEIYERLSHVGIGTIIGMHISEEHRKEAKKHHINLIVTGHMASDSIGMNLVADELEKKGVKIIPCSGFIRVKRKSIKSL